MNKSDCFFAGVAAGVVLMAISVSIIAISPMDVYQGKTTLKYEVVEGVKVDSIVVLKDNYKK